MRRFHKEPVMNLLEILQKLQAAKEPVLLRDGDGE